MTHLSESTSTITTVINSNMQDYIQWTTQSMLDGNTIIYNNEDGTQYELTTEQMDVFNAAYADGLANSTPEALTAVLLNDMIDVEQGTYEEEKDSLIEAASEIAAVTSIAEMLVDGLRSMQRHMQLRMIYGLLKNLVVSSSTPALMVCLRLV